MTIDRDALFRDSVIVTGTHYSMSTLVGRILGAAETFNLVHEPLNHESPLGYATVPTAHWYEYFDGDRSDHLAEMLKSIQFGQGVARETVMRMPRIRSGRDVLRVGKFARTGLLHAATPKRAVFKDPFLCFSARHLQENYGLWIVMTVRHPCGFAESLARRGSGFDFNDLMQPELLDAIPEMADEIERYASETQPVLQQAALLWRLVYGFADTYVLRHARTTFVRQEDIATRPADEAARLFSFVGAEKSAAVDRFMEETLNASSPSDFDRNAAASYVHRDARETTLKWRQRLSRDDIDTVMRITGNVPQRFGYAESGDVLEAVH
ncbi:MAG: hypothetical protein CL814_11705 [Confluentimicrobium sp.]|uniref:hypothetical protein n=1 Tax=Actibacterium sp. TaxID=1872125 RepID=UPI000C636C30|nr:hypothetical protein [Actibacterium sp.]MBC57581.1 hypothetical protein [Actibacterium sp.]